MQSATSSRQQRNSKRCSVAVSPRRCLSDDCWVTEASEGATVSNDDQSSGQGLMQRCSYILDSILSCCHVCFRSVLPESCNSAHLHKRAMWHLEAPMPLWDCYHGDGVRAYIFTDRNSRLCCPSLWRSKVRIGCRVSTDRKVDIQHK